MLPLVFASILAGGVICTIEFLFILLSCGPFWLGPGIFFKTWIIYTLPTLAGLILLNGLITLIPPLSQIFRDKVKRFFLYFILSWVLGTLLLTALVITDLDSGARYWPLILIALLVGLFTTGLLRKIISRQEMMVKGSVVVILVLALLGNGVYLISDLYYASIMHKRNASYRGNVPNLSLIVLDTARGDHFSCYGYPYPTTPNIDEIAAEGLLCKRAFSASNWTPPGHISIFTGKYPSQHGNDGKPYMPAELLSLTEILNGEGYFSVALYNNPLAGRNINLTQGFDLDVWIYRHSWVYPAWTRLRDKLIYKDSGSKATFPIALEASRWVNRKGGHLFLYLNLVEPHAGYVIHEPYFTEFTRDLEYSDIPNLAEVQGLCDYVEKVFYDSTKFARYNAASYRYLRAAYDSELAYLDHHFGVYSDGLRKAGLLDSTLLIITADHGEFLGEHFTRGHPDILFNPVLRIPLTFRYPQRIPSSVLEGYTSNVDVFPTALNLMGYSALIPEDVQGIDILDDHQTMSDRKLLCERIKGETGCYSLLADSYKLIINTNKDFLEKFPYDTLLLNLESDPAELQDLHGIQPELCDELAVELNALVSKIRVEAKSEIELSEDAVANLKALGYVQ